MMKMLTCISNKKIKSMGYMKYGTAQKEQHLKLKDGREIWKTHNGFKSFVKSQKGVVSEVTADYYKSVKHLGLGKNATR